MDTEAAAAAATPAPALDRSPWSPTTKEIAAEVGFDLDAGAGLLCTEAKKVFPLDLQPVWQSPGEAKGNMVAWEILHREGMRPRNMNANYIEKVGYKTLEDSKFKMQEEGVGAAMIHALDAAFRQLAEQSDDRKRKAAAVDNEHKPSFDSNTLPGSGSFGKDEEGPGAAGPTSKRAKTTATSPMFKHFYSDLRKIAVMPDKTAQVELCFTDDVLKTYCELRGGLAQVLKSFSLPSKTTADALYVRMRASLLNRANNGKKWMNEMDDIEDAMRWQDFGADKEEFIKYKEYGTTLPYLRNSLERLAQASAAVQPSPKLLFIVEGKERPMVVGCGALMNDDALDLATTDKDMVYVYILHSCQSKGSRNTLMLPSGKFILNPGTTIKKAKSVLLPVGCMLATFNGQEVKKWMSQHGCNTEDLWQAAMDLFVGAQNRYRNTAA